MVTTENITNESMATSLTGSTYGACVRDCLDMGGSKQMSERERANFEAGLEARLGRCWG
jgi:hypothetical protein